VAVCRRFRRSSNSGRHVKQRPHKTTPADSPRWRQRVDCRFRRTWWKRPLQRPYRYPGDYGHVSILWGLCARAICFSGWFGFVVRYVSVGCATSSVWASGASSGVLSPSGAPHPPCGRGLCLTVLSNWSGTRGPGRGHISRRDSPATSGRTSVGERGDALKHSVVLKPLG